MIAKGGAFEIDIAGDPLQAVLEGVAFPHRDPEPGRKPFSSRPMGRVVGDEKERAPVLDPSGDRLNLGNFECRRVAGSITRDGCI